MNVIRLSIRERLYYSAFFRFIIENYLVMSLMAFVIVFDYFDFNTWKEIANSCLAVVILGIMILIPVLLLIFFKLNK